MEEKYRWRNPVPPCPECGHAVALTRSKKGGWFCGSKKGGCGLEFGGNDRRIQVPRGRTENPNLPDTWNTCLQMAQKRAYVAGVRRSTASSDRFTQDVEDLPADSFQGQQEPRGNSQGNQSGQRNTKKEPAKKAVDQAPAKKAAAKKKTAAKKAAPKEGQPPNEQEMKEAFLDTMHRARDRFLELGGTVEEFHDMLSEHGYETLAKAADASSEDRQGIARQLLQMCEEMENVDGID